MESLEIFLAISKTGLARATTAYMYGDPHSGVGGRGVPLRGNKGYKPTITDDLFVGVACCLRHIHTTLH
mgnify:CR=1 FL=1